MSKSENNQNNDSLQQNDTSYSSVDRFAGQGITIYPSTMLEEAKKELEYVKMGGDHAGE